MLRLQDYLEGCIGQRGKFEGYIYKEGKSIPVKEAIWQKQQMDWDKHYAGVETYGLSPVKIIQNGNGLKGVCRWIGFDLDFKPDELLEPADFCKKLWRIHPELIPYVSSSGRYHVHYYFDEFVPADDARAKAEEIEKVLIKIFGKGNVDTSHTVPKYWNADKNKPGYWLFMPYSENTELKAKTKCLSPRGRPLTKEQCEFRINWRHIPVISSMVGLQSGDGGRENFLFIAQQVKQHLNPAVDPYEVNKYFDEPLSEPQLTKEILSHERKDYSGEYTKERLQESMEAHLKATTGFWRVPKTKKEKSELFEHLEEEEYTEEEEQKIKEIFENVIFMTVDDRWFDKSTYYKYGYKTSAIRTKYNGFFKKGFYSEWTNYEHRQIAEMSVYRPDLYNPDDIIILENKIPYLNIYRPGGVDPIPADNMQRKEELQMILDLIKKLTANEATGFDQDTGEEIDLNEYCLDHLAYTLQQPGEKIRRAILWHSEENQVGKTTIGKLMVKMLGSDNATIISPENAIARERGFIEHQFVFVDEIKIDGNIEEKRSTLNKLKPLMTDEMHDARPLFKDWRRVYAVPNFALATNFSDAMAMKTNEARYTTMDVGKTREELGGNRFYDPLYQAYKKGTLANVFKHFLLNRDIADNFNPSGKCLKTKFLLKMAKDGGHPLLNEMEMLFSEGQKPFDQSVISITDAWEYCKKEKLITKCKLNDFAGTVIELGGERIGECKHKWSGKKPHMYIIRNHDFFIDKTKSDIVNKFWVPIGTTNTGNDKWSLSAGDATILEGKQKEIDAFVEYMVDGVEKSDDDIPLQEIRKARTKSRLKDAAEE